jgi:NAD(P)-dependent dehydrogenase (short-subunit alcohol dehydrogenase family)
VLLFGGGVGIGAEIGVDLAARHGATVVAMGRTPWNGNDPYPEAPTDAGLAEAVHAELAGAEGKRPQAAKLQQALARARRQRDLTRTALRVREAGGRFEYRCADVTSERDVERELAWIRDQLGPVELVIHAAGIVEDRLLGGKSIESFRRVLHTKIRSAFHVRRAIRAMAPRRVALFSSLVAHTGNAGQADYCAANEVLGAVANEWTRDGAHVVSFLWSVWTETGLAGHGVQSLMKHHQLAGITSLDGARYFHAEMARASGPSWVLVTSPRTIEVMRRGPLTAPSEVSHNVRRSA